MSFHKFLINCEEFIVDIVNNMTDAIDEGKAKDGAERKAEEDSLTVNEINFIFKCH